MNRTACRKRALKRQKQLEATHARPAAHPVLAGLHLPEDSSGRAARLVLLGSSRALVENHLGVRDYTETHLSLLSGRGAIEITGDALLLTDVRKGALIVSGKIYRVELTDA